MVGKVVAVGTGNTVIVIVERTKTHPLYGKSFIRTKRYQVHDGLGAKKGDVVNILKIRPMSRRKHWKIEKIVGKDFELIAKEGLDAATDAAIAEVMPTDEVSDKSDEIGKSVNQKTGSTDSQTSDLSDLSEKPKKTRVKKESKK